MITDPSIILFGKRIGSPESPNFPSIAAAGGESRGGHFMIHNTSCLEDSHDEFTQKDQQIYVNNPEDEMDDNPKTPPIDKEGMLEEPQTTGSDLQPKTLKKPDKILPCPRCESMDTKFCYYNNSNVNQPRHFCKSCQRYWTAGGTMRNMPVGAGRRKKKNQPSNCRYIITQEAFESAVAPQKVLSFAPNSPHFEPNLSGVSCKGKENADDCSNTVNSNSVSEKLQENSGLHPQLHWIPRASWPYTNPWNATLPMPIPMPIQMPMPMPMSIPPPMPMYPSPYWSSVSWLPPPTYAQNYSVLGKHSSDGEARIENEEPKKQRNSVLTPKTLRIDDPDEAAKSSIWATLGIKNENNSKGNLFKVFQAKGDEKKKHTETEPSPVLHANPAALSRSLCFQERA